MNKKQITLIVVLNIFLILLGGIIIRGITNHTLNTFGTSLESHMGSKIKDIKKSNAHTLQSYFVDTINIAKHSVVTITISKDIKFYIDDPSQINGPGSISQQTSVLGGGSGIIVSKKGYIITNKHVIQDTNAKYAVITHDGKSYNVDKIRFDDVLDLAVLKIVDAEGGIPKNLIPSTFLSLTTTVHVGQYVFAIGNTLSQYHPTVTMGIISSKNKKLNINGNNLYIGLYQTDAQSNPGNSGGPLIDIDGHVLGIVTAMMEGEGMSFVLPITQEFIESTITSIESFGHISRPVMGIQYVEMTPALKIQKNVTLDKGIYITDVLTDLSAWEAGLKAGDIILAINANDITTESPFLYQLYTHIPGETIQLTVLRDNEEINIALTLGGNSK